MGTPADGSGLGIVPTPRFALAPLALRSAFLSPGFEILIRRSRGIFDQRTMDVTIIQEEDNPMLHRTDVRFEVTHDEATPSRLSVRDSLAAKLNKDAKEVVIHELDTKFGMRKTVGYAKVYDSPEYAQDVEQEYMLERNKIAQDGETAEEA